MAEVSTMPAQRDTASSNFAHIAATNPALNQNGIDAFSSPKVEASNRSEMLSGSQESYISISSNGSSAPRLQSSSSNLSSITIPDSVRTSPISSTTQLVPASKRTASGAVKPSPSSPARPQIGHSRNASTDTNASRVGELSAQLKARLSYALVKVQNGWEKESLSDLERKADAMRTPVDSPRSVRRLSTTSSPATSYAASPGLGSLQNSPPRSAQRPVLAPAPDLTPHRRPARRQSSTHAPPSLSSAHRHTGSRTSQHTELMSPRTPTSTNPAARPASILRMPSGQAEKDALETLIFMSSPNNSSNMKNGGSPLRMEFGPSLDKRVAFERAESSSSSGEDGGLVAQLQRASKGDVRMGNAP